MHTAEPPLPISAHDGPNGKLPDPDELSVTVPSGGDEVAPMSDTVAVQVA